MYKSLRAAPQLCCSRVTNKYSQIALFALLTWLFCSYLFVRPMSENVSLRACTSIHIFSRRAEAFVKSAFGYCIVG